MNYATLHDDAFAYDEYLCQDELYQEYVDSIEYELWIAQAQQQQDENDEFWSEEEPTFFLEEGWNQSQNQTSSSEEVILSADEVRYLYIYDEEQFSELLIKDNVKVIWTIQHVQIGKPLVIEEQLLPLNVYLQRVGHLLEREKSDALSDGLDPYISLSEW